MINGKRKKKKKLFMVRSCQSDADGPLKGNLTVYPGSHKILQDCINEAGGPQELFTTDPARLVFLKDTFKLCVSSSYHNQEAMSDPQSASLKKLKQVAHDKMGAPVQVREQFYCYYFQCFYQVRAKAGDVVIAHYQLAHCIAPNVSADIRLIHVHFSGC